MVAVASGIVSAGTFACSVQEFTYRSESDAGSVVDVAQTDSGSGGITDAGTPDVDGPVSVVDASDGGRVASGLVALYTFKEKDGTLAHDTSGFGVPLDLTVTDPLGGLNNAKWTGDGLLIEKQTVVVSQVGAAKKIIDRCVTTQGLTVETWINPANVPIGNQITRVVGLATTAAASASFSIRSEGLAYVAYFDSQSVVSAPNSVKKSLTHVVFTRDATGRSVLYVDAVPTINAAGAGNFKNWKVDDRVTIANSTDFALDWLGTVKLVAFYDRALTSGEVATNFNAH